MAVRRTIHRASLGSSATRDDTGKSLLASLLERACLLSKFQDTYQLLHCDRARAMSERIGLVLWTSCVYSTTDAWILMLQ